MTDTQAKAFNELSGTEAQALVQGLRDIEAGRIVALPPSAREAGRVPADPLSPEGKPASAEVEAVAQEMREQSRLGIPPRASKCGEWADRLSPLKEHP